MGEFFETEKDQQVYLEAEAQVNQMPLDLGFDWGMFFLLLLFGGFL